MLERGLGDFAVIYELNVSFSDAAAVPRIEAELQRNILDVFTEEGIAIMTAAYVADPPDLKILPVIKPNDSVREPAG